MNIANTSFEYAPVYIATKVSLAFFVWLSTVQYKCVMSNDGAAVFTKSVMSEDKGFLLVRLVEK